MNIKKIAGNIAVRPTDRKIKQVKQTIQNSGVLPHDMPLERDIYITSKADIMESVKNKIQISIENMKRNS